MGLTDKTVVTPHATVNYGSNWFRDFAGLASVTVLNYGKPLLIMRPVFGRRLGDCATVELKTDQGSLMVRMVVFDNFDDVMKLTDDVKMDGGDGDPLKGDRT